MGLEHVILFKTALIQQQIDPLPGSQAALGMELINPFLTPANPGLGSKLLFLLQIKYL